jgi:hypothetical protein
MAPHVSATERGIVVPLANGEGPHALRNLGQLLTGLDREITGGRPAVVTPVGPNPPHGDSQLHMTVLTTSLDL